MDDQIRRLWDEFMHRDDEEEARRACVRSCAVAFIAGVMAGLVIAICTIEIWLKVAVLLLR